jgi:hypothetical protein
MRRLHPPPPLAVAVVLVAVWLLAAPHTPDLAAQVYRANLFRDLGFVVWDAHWYGGHTLPGYSLLFPPLAALLGVWALGAVCALSSTALFTHVARRTYGARAGWAGVWFAVAAVADVWAGRVTFALGVALALAAVAAFASERAWLAAPLAALSAAGSPVAGALLALAGITLALARREWRPALVLALAPALVIGALVALFAEGGFEPYPFTSFLATVAVVLAFVWAMPPSERLLRLGAGLYLLAVVACLLVHTPLGSNIERYGALLAGPLLICVGPQRRLATAVALLAAAVWTLWGPVRETAAVAGSEATSAAYYRPVERYLETLGPVRVEVPLTRSHWEAAYLAPKISLARGWEKQLDERYDAVLLGRHLTAASYLAWLRRQAVGYVALADAPADHSSAAEAQLVRGGLPYLRLVFASRHWSVYRVLGATPLVSGPGRLSGLGHDRLSLVAAARGRLLVRVHYSRYLGLAAGAGCVRAGADGWTEVDAAVAGPLVVAARFSLARALSGGASCAGGASATEAFPADPPGAGHALDYSWSVRVTGAPPSVAEENRYQGTTAWRLAGPPGAIGGRARGAIAGYVASQSIAPGQTQSIYVRAPGAQTVTMRLYRMGWYGGSGGRLVLASALLPVRAQPPCRHSPATGLTECRWHPTLRFRIPEALPSGVFIAKLQASNGAQSDCIFVVRPRRARRLMVVMPTATWEAYNGWGGDSLYPGGERVTQTGSTQGVEVSYDRPYATETGAGQFFIREVAAVRFIERFGYPAGYTTSESLDADPGELRHARAVLDVGHSEYWSGPELGAVTAARERGTSLVFLSSDTLAWRVRFAAASAASSQAGERDHRIVAYKQYGRSGRGAGAGLFLGGGAQLTGSAYNGCITPRVARSGPPDYRFYGWSPAPGLQPSWLFAGTRVGPLTRIPGIVGYELDERAPASPPATVRVGGGVSVACQGFDEPSPVRGYQADTTLYRAPSGALVFASGTLGWLYGLEPVPEASPDAPAAPDPRVVGMTRNVLARALGSSAP